jgi:hypothetical protein
MVPPITPDVGSTVLLIVTLFENTAPSEISGSCTDERVIE